MKTKKYYTSIEKSAKENIKTLADKGSLYFSNSTKEELELLSCCSGTGQVFTIYEIIVKPIKIVKVVKIMNTVEIFKKGKVAKTIKELR